MGSRPTGSGILGPRPQAYSTVGLATSYSPTDIEATMQALSFSQSDGNYYMDTSATSHMTADQGILSPYFNSSIKHNNIVIGSGHLIPIAGHGSTTLHSPFPPFTLKNVLHAPKLIKNLISVRKFTIDNMVSITFDPYRFSVNDLQTGITFLRCNNTGALYPLFSSSQANSPATNTAFTAISPELWHNRLGHPGVAVLKSLSCNKFIDCNKACKSYCSSCSLGKLSKLPFYDSVSHTILPFDIIYNDLWTSPIISSSGHCYFVLFLDDYSKFLWTFPISKKSQVKHLFKSFFSLIHTQFERYIKTFQCDNGTEYINGTFKEFFDRHGMLFRLSFPHSSPQNEKAERHIKSINNVIRTLLAHASLPLSFLHHALQMATYLLNILPTKVLGFKSPTQILYQCDPIYSELRVFGCLCFPLFPSTTIHKLQERSTPCVYLGPSANHRGSKCYNMSNGKIIISRHVKFIEIEFPFAKLHKPNKNDYYFLDYNPIMCHLQHQDNTQLSSTPNVGHNSGSISHGPEPVSPSSSGPISHSPATPSNTAAGSPTQAPTAASPNASLEQPNPQQVSLPYTKFLF